MIEGYHSYIPSQGHGLPHDPFNAIIAPRPIGWISSKSAHDQVNLAPYSFFNAFNYTPPIIGFSSVGYKDSVRNIEQTGEFCWNLASRDLAQAMNQTSASVDPNTDEFALAGLEKRDSVEIDVPHVAASPVVMECIKTQIVQLKSARGASCDTYLVLGEVVAVHIVSSALKDGIYDTAAQQPVLRGGGPADYFAISEALKFQMHRP